MKMTFVLAFDIERSGSGKDNHTIGIGMSVVDSNLKELDRLFLPGYVEKDVVFEERCVKQFWSKHPSKLEVLRYNGPLNFKERQREMIVSFQNFRRKWERKAKETRTSLQLVSDNNVYDGGFINEMIFEYTDDFPIPYTASSTRTKPNEADYEAFHETHSIQRGLLFSVDKKYMSEWSHGKRISELYDLPQFEKVHDHNPANDAYSIACDMQVLFGIRDGVIILRK